MDKGVQKADFDVTGDKEFGLFNNGQKYNHAVITGYLDGTTPNPPVVGTNDTLKTDLRAFGSDGNVTMNKLANKSTFDATYSILIANNRRRSFECAVDRRHRTNSEYNWRDASLPIIFGR